MFNEEEQMCENLPGRIVQQSLTARLAGEKHRLEKRLSDVNAAIEAMNSNPGIREAVDAISKLGHI